jgi:uncharacterized membrane protein YphA (DoxX/SURF4 family)
MTNEGTLRAFLLMTCRLVAGGALVLAGLIKIANPSALMLSMKGYQILPETLIPFAAYGLPWAELTLGLLLLYGAWSREAALLATALYVTFTLAVVSVLARNLSLDCGCFGGMFGESAIGWNTVVRNLVFIVASGVVAWVGPGPLAIDALADTSSHPSSPNAARKRTT